MGSFVRFALAGLLASGAGAACAASYTVTVGGYVTSGGDGYYGGGTTTPVLMFDPPTRTINVGDSVTFINPGGGSTPHNVHADDDSFMCSNGCRGDGSGATGTPSSGEWSATVTFNKAGTVNYHCDVHQAMGMTGSITVNAVAASGQPIVGGLSGNWNNPTANQSGHGFQIEVLPNNGLLAIWFVFNPPGTAQNWIYAQGGYDAGNSSATIAAFLEQGGAFPPNFDGSKIVAPPWGQLGLAFSDCNNGTATWTPNADAIAAGYAATTFPIRRVTQIAGVACP